MKIAIPLVAILLLSGCGMGLFSGSPPDKVSGDSDGVIFKGSGETDRRNAAAAYCATFNKAAVVLPRERGDSSSLSRFSCR
ncbi:MAG: hypothetical protein ACM30I_14185 [Gemmatimonas sp.]